MTTTSDRVHTVAPHADGEAPADDVRVAVIGLACRFPGADTPARFWANLVEGQDTITRSPGDGASPFGHLEGAQSFDNAFFGLSPREALLLDPQQRVFLASAWEAVEDAGYDPRRTGRVTGIFAGSSQTTYLDLLRANRADLGPVGDWQMKLATGVDFLTSRAAFKLGLTGPAVTVQTGCSTSLVAVHQAVQSLLAGDCDLALAGGSTVHFPDADDEPQEGVITRDGYCRPFDVRATGTVPANGVGVVVLKRFADAVADGDDIRAVLLGSSVNNDGMDKIGFTAPSASGQARCIATALEVAGVPASSIGYVEAHGTATPLGDPIELAGLTAAFRRDTDERGFCLIGSVKSNIGHTDAAAGVAGLIKVVLALQHGKVPASLYFTEPNPALNLSDSPFRVCTGTSDWPDRGAPRRAGVSSFGIGGTNAHVVLEEPPRAPHPPREDGRAALLVVSARTGDELVSAAGRLAGHLERHPDLDLHDVAHTLRVGRSVLGHRAAVVAGSSADAVDALRRAVPREARPGAEVVFLYPGQGSQHVGMARGLFLADDAFAQDVTECAEHLVPLIGFDLREVLAPQDDRATAVADRALQSMRVGQCAVFVVQYATTRWWARRGVRPVAVAGHSLGSYAAAQAAGSLSLVDALDLVATRGRLFDTLPPGAMLAVSAPTADVEALIRPPLAVAVVNSDEQCVVSGPAGEVRTLAEDLRERGIECRVLRVAAAGHSALVENVLSEYADAVSRVRMHPPQVPWVDDMTGELLPPERPPARDHWVRHMREAVRFDRVAARLRDTRADVLLELGPGRVLTSLLRRSPGSAPRPAPAALVTTLPHPAEELDSLHTALEATGRLWEAGVDVAWDVFTPRRPRRVGALPTYPFTGRRFSPGPARGAAEPPRQHLSTRVPPQRTTSSALTAVTEAFREVLGLDDIGAEDNFFELGGDSLVASRLAALLGPALGARITVKQVLAAPTPSSLSRLVGRDAGTAAVPTAGG